jgi:hypothetical protein
MDSTNSTDLSKNHTNMVKERIFIWLTSKTRTVKYRY